MFQLMNSSSQYLESPSVVSDSLRPHGLYSHVQSILQVRILEWVAFHFSRGSSQPRDPTHGSNPGLLHCRQILYQLNHQGSPLSTLGRWKETSLDSSAPAILPKCWFRC